METFQAAFDPLIGDNPKGEAGKDALRLGTEWLRSMVLFLSMSILSWPTAYSATTVLEADNQRHWVRGNMHTHSHWSDGDDYLDMIALWYRKHGYQFLVFTDHNVLADSQRWIDVERSKGGQIVPIKLLE